MPERDEREYYARRAVEVRTIARAATDHDIRATLERIAASYDRLVEQADRIDHVRLRLPKD